VSSATSTATPANPAMIIQISLLSSSASLPPLGAAAVVVVVA
jgi:hypothetical protein